jgi:hypothetical protein
LVKTRKKWGFLRTESLLLNWSLYLQYFYRYVKISNVCKV